MNQRSHRNTFSGQGVVSIHRTRAFENLQPRSLDLQPLSGFLGHLEAFVLALSDDDGLRAVLDQLPNIVGLDTGGVVCTRLGPVPSSAASRPELGITKVSDVGVDTTPFEIGDQRGECVDDSAFFGPGHVNRV